MKRFNIVEEFIDANLCDLENEEEPSFSVSEDKISKDYFSIEGSLNFDPPEKKKISVSEESRLKSVLGRVKKKAKNYEIEIQEKNKQIYALEGENQDLCKQLRSSRDFNRKLIAFHNSFIPRFKSFLLFTTNKNREVWNALSDLDPENFSKESVLDLIKMLARSINSVQGEIVDVKECLKGIQLYADD